MQPFKYTPKKNSGSSRHWVKIFKPPGPDDVDEVGQPLEDWMPVTETWADVYPLRGRELFAAQQAHAEVTTRITIRYQEDIDRTMKIVYEDVEFEILYIIHKEYAKRDLELICRKWQ